MSLTSVIALGFEHSALHFIDILKPHRLIRDDDLAPSQNSPTDLFSMLSALHCVHCEMTEHCSLWQTMVKLHKAYKGFAPTHGLQCQCCQSSGKSAAEHEVICFMATLLHQGPLSTGALDFQYLLEGTHNMLRQMDQKPAGLMSSS